MKKLSLIFIVFFILGLSTASFSSEGCLLFDGTFGRSAKNSATNVLSTKTSETPIGQFNAVDGAVIVKVYNGAQREEAQKVSSAKIFINGKEVISPSDFNQNVDYIEKMCQVNNGDNSLKVLLKSKPGGEIRVVIMQPNTLRLSASDGDGAADICPGDTMYPNKVIGTISVGQGPYGEIAVSPHGAYVYVTNYVTNEVAVIQTDIGKLIKTIPVGNQPYGIAVSPYGEHVYVSNYAFSDASVSVIQPFNDYATPISVGYGPLGVSMTSSGDYVYVCNYYDNTVSVIETSTNTVIKTVPVGIRPAGVAVAPHGDQVYVTNYYDNTVSVIQMTKNTVTETIGVGEGPHGIAVTPDGSYVYVSDYDSDTVSAINTSDHTVTTIPVGGMPDGIAVTPSGKYVYVSNFADDTVSVIQTSNNKTIATISVGDGPKGVAVSPDGAYVYASSFNDGMVYIIGD